MECGTLGNGIEGSVGLGLLSLGGIGINGCDAEIKSRSIQDDFGRFFLHIEARSYIG